MNESWRWREMKKQTRSKNREWKGGAENKNCRDSEEVVGRKNILLMSATVVASASERNHHHGCRHAAVFFVVVAAAAFRCSYLPLSRLVLIP